MSAEDDCPVMGMKSELLSKLKVREIPPSFMPSDRSLHHFKSNLRLWFTNYYELLKENEEIDNPQGGSRVATGLCILCTKHILQNGGACKYEHVDQGERWWLCPTLFEIHSELKRAAGEKAFQKWLRSQE